MDTVVSISNFPGLEELQAFLASQSKVPFITSELYSSAVDSKIVNPELRQSTFRTFTNAKLFELVHQVVEGLNHDKWLNNAGGNYSKYTFQLRRDNITEIRYGPGGHFSKHKDFLSVTSNLIEEFTLLLCVTPPDLAQHVVGGETVLYPYGKKKEVNFDITTIPGCGILFRKDFDHAGALLESGHKHILTANIWATRKDQSSQVLWVTFPPMALSNKKASTTTTQHEAKKRCLARAADQDTSYALPVGHWKKGTKLEEYVRRINNRHQDRDENLPTVIPYCCTKFSYEEFGTVAKILGRAYVNEDNLRKHTRAIRYFGPFENANLLVDLAAKQQPLSKNDDVNNKEEASCERFVKPPNATTSHRTLFGKKSKTVEAKSQEEKDDLDVIVCESESRAKVVYNVARLLGLDDYVPFKMLFVEGTILNEGMETTCRFEQVTPLGLLVGDYNHVFGLQNVRNDTLARTLKDMHHKHFFDVDLTEGEWIFREEAHDDDWELSELFAEECRGLGLKVALGESNKKRHWRHFLTTYTLYQRFCEVPRVDIREDLFALSDFSGEGKESDNRVEEYNHAGKPQKLFHRDENYKATFTKKEAASASRFIAEMNLDERVKAKLQQKRWELPQETADHEEYYCNDTTYSNMSILCLSGLLKLDSAATVKESSHLSKKVQFDAWPIERMSYLDKFVARNNGKLPDGLPDHYYDEFNRYINQYSMANQMRWRRTRKKKNNARSRRSWEIHKSRAILSRCT